MRRLCLVLGLGLVTIVGLGLLSCRAAETDAERARSKPPPEEMAAPSEPTLHVATFVRFQPVTDPAGPPAGETAWIELRAGLLEVERRLGVVTLFDEPIESASGDCEREAWDRALLQEFPDTAALAELLQSPERTAVIDLWPRAVADFHRVSGRPLAPPARPPLPLTIDTRDRFLLLETEDRIQAQSALTAESVFLDEAEAQVLMQHELVPDLNDAEVTWDLFTVTRFASGQLLDHPPSEIRAIRTELAKTVLRSCRLVGRPVDGEAVLAPAQVAGSG